MKSISIIAEIGSNFDSNIKTAVAYVQACKNCGANAIKFQTLEKNKLVAPRILSSEQWIDNPAHVNFRNIGLPEKWHAQLKEIAEESGIEFLSTPFYIEAVDLLDKVGVRTYKVASGDITYFPLLEAIGRTGKQVLLSTGASSLGDIERALNVLLMSGAGEITLLHCVANYPPQWEEMNLRAITTLKQAFGFPVGISDHSSGTLVPIAAVALGATVIEKHVTFDRSLPGPDHPFAMTIDEFGEMVKQIRLLEKALGTGRKLPSEVELAKQHRLRRGVYDPVTFEPTSDKNGIWLRPEHS